MNRLQRGPRPKLGLPADRSKLGLKGAGPKLGLRQKKDPGPVHYMLNRSAWLRTLELGEAQGNLPPGRFDLELLKMELIPPGVEVIPVVRETFRLVWGRWSVEDINQTGEYLDETKYFKKS